MSRNRKGVTLIEVLGVIVILGVLATVGIVSVSKLLQKARENHYKTQRDNLVIAAQSYFDIERNQLPRNIGQSKEICLDKLKESGIIGQILNYDKKPCSETTSCVKVTKYASNKYSYYATLDCPGVSLDDEDKERVTPVIRLIKNVDDRTITMIIHGDSTNEVGVLSYSYVLYKKTDNISEVEIINTGDKHVKGTKEITERLSLNKHGVGEYRLSVKAVNIYGFIQTGELKMTVDEGNSVCSNITVETIASDGSIISKDEGLEEGATLNWTNADRKVTFECNNCDKPEPVTFSKNTVTKDIDITRGGVKVGSCNVPVYIDKTAPTVTMNVFACKDSEHKATKEGVLASVTVNNKTRVKTLLSTDITNNVSGWMNKANAPYGLCYKFSAEDNNGLTEAKWSWNKSGLKVDELDSVGVLDGVTSTATSPTRKVLSTETANITHSLSGDGVRRAKLEIKDVAGNVVAINIESNLDKAAPSVPTVVGYKKANSSKLNCSASVSDLTTYTSGSWYKGYVYTKASGSTDTMSGGVKYYLTTTGQGSDNITNSNQSCRNTSTEATSSSSVKNTYKACDAAGNCSNGTTFTIKLDRTAPSVPTTHFYKWANNNTLPSSTSGLSSYTPGNWSKMKIYTKPGGSTDTGVGGVYYQYTTTGVTANDTDKTGEYRTIQADGSSTIKYRACDSLSNCSNYNTEQTVMVDTTKPTVTIDYSTTGANAFKYTGSATDATSGVSKYYKFTKDKSNPSSLSFSNTDNSAISSPGSYITANKYYAKGNYARQNGDAYVQSVATADTYYLCVKDNAGNIGCSGGKNDHVMCKKSSDKQTISSLENDYPLVYLWKSTYQANEQTCTQGNRVTVDSDVGDSGTSISATGPYIKVNIVIYGCVCQYDTVGFKANKKESVCSAKLWDGHEKAVHNASGGSYAYIVYANSPDGETECRHSYGSGKYVSAKKVQRVCSEAFSGEADFHGWRWNSSDSNFAQLPVGDCTSGCDSTALSTTKKFSERSRRWLHNGTKTAEDRVATNSDLACQYACQNKAYDGVANEIG